MSTSVIRMVFYGVRTKVRHGPGIDAGVAFG